MPDAGSTTGPPSDRRAIDIEPGVRVNQSAAEQTHQHRSRPDAETVCAGSPAAYTVCGVAATQHEARRLDGATRTCAVERRRRGALRQQPVAVRAAHGGGRGWQGGDSEG